MVIWAGKARVDAGVSTDARGASEAGALRHLAMLHPGADAARLGDAGARRRGDYQQVQGNIEAHRTCC